MKFDMPVFLRTYVGTELKSVFAREIGNCQADIRNPLRCLLIAEELLRSLSFHPCFRNPPRRQESFICRHKKNLAF